jgi:hypothetical protein
VRGLSRDEIADVLITIHPQSPNERELKRRAQEYVVQRDRARREDIARAPEVTAVRRTYETAKALAEVRRDALAAARPALENQPGLANEVQKAVVGWEDQQPVVAKSSEDQIEELKTARANALSYAFHCDKLIDEVVAQLGDDHPASRQLREAKELL